MAFAAKIKSPRTGAIPIRRQRTMYGQIISRTEACVKCLRGITYKPRHRRVWIDWEAPCTDSQRFGCAVITGLMLAVAIFASFCR